MHNSYNLTPDIILIKKIQRISQSDTAIAGGKGASLGEMTQIGIPVPPGFVILSDAFEKFLVETELDVEIGSILHFVDYREMHTIENASEKIEALILQAEMPKFITEEIQIYFKNLDAKYVAVRSSATAEDSTSAAWAGQLDSFLNTTEENLLENVKKCWASLFTPRAIFYRFENKLHNQKVKVAVVVQKMIESETSGVAFSVHPVTQDKNQLIIEAVLGLGEAIVSGQITPDSYIVEKDSLVILDKNINHQKKIIVRSKSIGNKWQILNEGKRRIQKLSDGEILKLSDLIITIEKHYGFPCDIEWAMEQGIFYIIQCRPITTLRKKKGSDRNDLEKYKDTIFWELAGMPFFHSLLYYWTKPSKQKYFSCSREFIVKYESSGKLSGYTSKKAFIEPGYAIIQEILSGKKDYLVKINSFKKQLKEQISYLEKSLLEKDIDFNFIDKIFIIHSNALKLIFPFDFAMTEQMKVLAKDNKNIFDCFLVKSAPKEKSFISEENGDFSKIISTIKKRKLSYLFSKESNEISDLINQHFIKYHWIENSYAGSKHLTVDYFWRRLEIELNSKSNDEKTTIASAKINKLPKDLNLLAKVTSIVFDIRDLKKKLMIIGVQLMDNFLQNLSQKTSIEYDQLAWLSFFEIKNLITNNSKLEKQSKKHHIAGYRYGVLKDGGFYDTDTIFYQQVEKLHKTTVKNSFKGLVASPGKVVGRAKIVLHYSDMEKVESGDILICSMTRPDILPAMRKASAFVTNEGGITCHAAIAAREMRKPCIIATKIATKFVKDGMLVEVDANNGIVNILNKTNDS